MKRLEVEDMETVLQIFLLVVGFTMLIKGADFFVDGSSGIASRFGIPRSEERRVGKECL